MVIEMPDENTSSKASEEERQSALMLFESLAPKDAGEIDYIMERVELAAGEVLFEEGDPGEALYIIRGGEIEVHKRTPEGAELPLATLGKFAMLGEMSLITDGPRTATAVARKPTRLYRIRKSAIRYLLDRDSIPAYKICLAIARFLAHRLEQVDQKLVAMSDQISPAG